MATYDPGIDPVRARRKQVARWTLLANRIGYLVLALAVALFVIAFAVGFSSTMATLVVIAMIVSFVLLVPSIILGYAVKAAERDDRERGL
jgi:membrane protein YdbS with pleckstrin-like domain